MSTKIEKLRAEAKRLKRAFAAGDAGATNRLSKFIEDAKTPKHADFLHVIARENQHESWPKLKFALEAANMTRDQRAERLKTALYHGQHWMVRRLLELEPTLAQHNLGLQIAMYNIGAVRTALENNPSAATQAIGIRTPILHLAYSKYIHMKPEMTADMLDVATLLLASGADVDDGYEAEPGSSHKLSALYGALGHADNIALAEWLLNNGACPDDDESLYHATELGHHDGLKLLIKHGVSTRGTNALPRALDFDDLEAVRLLLEHGADPNEAVTGHPSGEPIDTIPALHQAARRWCSTEIAGILLDHGADPRAIWQGHTPYATALIHGNHEFAAKLESIGHATQLSPDEDILVQCASGRSSGRRLDLQKLNPADLSLLTQLAGNPDRLDHLAALIAAGLDPNRPDDMGMIPLHAAAWAGLPQHIAYLLSLAPDLEHRNAYGGDALGTAIHGAEHNPDAGGRDHTGCVRLLLNAGAILRQQDIDHAGNETMAEFLRTWKNEPGSG